MLIGFVLVRCLALALSVGARAQGEIIDRIVAVVDDEARTVSGHPAERLDDAMLDHWLAKRNDVSQLEPLPPDQNARAPAAAYPDAGTRGVTPDVGPSAGEKELAAMALLKK